MTIRNFGAMPQERLRFEAGDKTVLPEQEIFNPPPPLGEDHTLGKETWTDGR